MPGPRTAKSIAVIDTSCLLNLLHLNLLHKLVLRYSIIYIPRHVLKETSRRGRHRYLIRSQLKAYNSFLKRCAVGNEVDARILYDLELNPKAPIDQGEAEAIIQARERSATEVLIDELKGREIAKKHSLKVIGTIGILKELKIIGIVEEIKPLIEKLRQDLGFYINEKLLRNQLEEIGED